MTATLTRAHDPISALMWAEQLLVDQPLQALLQVRAGSRKGRTVPDVQTWDKEAQPPTDLADDELDGLVHAAHNADLARLPALSAFLKQVESYPQLSADAQAQLVHAVQHSRAAKAQVESGTLTGRALRQARAAVTEGDRNLEVLVGSNFRLVLLITRELAVRRHGRAKGMSLLPDLVSEANIAMTEAVLNWDPARTPTFPAHAARTIRDRVRAALSTSGQQMRMPSSWSRLRRIAHVRVPQLEAALGRRPSTDEIRADLLERCMEWAAGRLTEDQQQLPHRQQVELMHAKLRKAGMLGALNNHLEEILAAPQHLVSIDAPVGGDTTTTVAELALADDVTEDDMLRNVALDELRKSLQMVLGSLDDRARRILLLRYGFVDGDRWTYARIAEQFDVTPERIRQIERQVLDRLASPHAGADQLAPHLASFDPHAAAAPVAPPRRFR